jgi:hypothetical protein
MRYNWVLVVNMVWSPDSLVCQSSNSFERSRSSAIDVLGNDECHNILML